MKKQVPLIIAALSLAVAAGGFTFGFKAANEKKSALEEARQLREQLAASSGEVVPLEENQNESVVSLKDTAASTNDIAELRKLLAAREAELERLQAEAQDRQRQPRESFQDRIARMKEEEPERYAEMVQRRTEFQERIRYDQAERLSSFVNMDTSNMTEAELQNHNMLVEKLSSIWEQTGDFDPDQQPDREAMREVFQTMREVNDLMDTERTTMFRQLGTEVGLSGTESEEFASYVESIIEATTMRMPGRGGGMPGGGGR